MSQTNGEQPGREGAPPTARRVLRSLVPNLVINGVLPLILYQLLIAANVPVLPALLAGAIFPVAYTVWGWVRARRLDAVAGVVLFFIVVSGVASLISGSTRFTLVKESFFTGLFGLAFFLSLLAPRPLMFYMARQGATGGDTALVQEWDGRWRHPGFRHAMRVMTVMWGVCFMVDALIRAGLVFVLSTGTFLVVSQVLFYAMFAATLSLTMAYARRAQGRRAR
jgi:hypothetical protein